MKKDVNSSLKGTVVVNSSESPFKEGRFTSHHKCGRYRSFFVVLFLEQEICILLL